MAKKGSQSVEGPLKGSQDEVVVGFTSSLSFDMELYFWDIVGSLAHVDSLRSAGVLPAGEHRRLRSGLVNVLNAIRKGKALLRPELEDIHMNVEALLYDEIGALAGKLHTGRSRNDQIVLDLKLYCRERILDVLEELSELQKVLLAVAKKNVKTVMPGMTHLQPAQPVSLAHHMMAHWFKLARDADRLLGCYDRLNECPLGAGALAGNTYGIDRFEVARALGFKGPTENAMDSVSDRDFVAETIFGLSMVMTHLSSIAEELIIWSNPQFGFVRLSPALTTGSSMMPQKRNPDIAELTRGKAGRVTGDLVSILTMLKGLPLAYNRDLQEDKEPLFDAFDSCVDSIWAMRSLLSTAEFDTLRMEESCLASHLTATDLADYLVLKGMPFRQAYDLVKMMVEESVAKSSPIEEWSREKMKKHSRLFDEDVRDYLLPERAMERRSVHGGTSSGAVRKSLASAKRIHTRQLRGIAKLRDDLEGTVSRLLG